jgi:hypothetical protein
MRPDILADRGEEYAWTHTTAELCELAANGLVQMLDPNRQLFCNTYLRAGGTMHRQGHSARYTMMTLLGLHRYETSGRSSPVAITPVLDALLADTRWISSAGDLGLLLWTCAELVPERLPEIYARVRAWEALTHFPDGQHGYTMEVAWYLTGLMSCCLVGNGDLPGLYDQAQAAREILQDNCGVFGIYGHRSRGGPLVGYLRKRIGSFADQVYPTIALARMAMAFNDENARYMAIRTARTMCELQAPLGEWSWQYDARTGRVVSRYPVYSVHQHAMAPMMLFAVGDISGSDFGDAVSRGLAWISGNNELRRDLVEPSLGLIWRCIYLRPIDAYADAAFRFFELQHGTADARLKIRYECRPYELGWLLYAFGQ